MKKLRFPALLLVLLLLGACSKTVIPDVTVPPTDPFGAADSPSSVPTADLSGLLSAKTALDQAESSGEIITKANSGEGLVNALNGKHNKCILFETDAAGAVGVDSGSYSDTTLLLKAPNADLTMSAAVGAVRLDALSSCTLNAHVGMLSVYGADIAVTLSGGADNVYVQGKNCTLRLTGGVYGVIYCVNQTVKVENGTAATVYVTVGSGATQAVGPGESLSF